MTRRTTDIARVALTDTTVTATLAPAAIAAMEAGAGGYATSTPGASAAEAQGATECPRQDCDQSRPCPTHDPDATVHLTPTERLATTPDTALRDLEAFNTHIRKMAHHARAAATIAARWGYQGIDDTDVKTRLVAIDSEIWCSNCSRYGRHEPRKPGKTECDFCDGFRERRFKRGTNGGIWQAPPKEIWDARDARNGRLDETTIARILRNIEDARKAAVAQAKATLRSGSKVSIA